MRCGGRVEKADAVSWLLSLAPRSVDLIITDPAYESLEKHRARGTTTRLSSSKASSNAWFPIFRNARFESLFEATNRALKSGRSSVRLVRLRNDARGRSAG